MKDLKDSLLFIVAVVCLLVFIGAVVDILFFWPGTGFDWMFLGKNVLYAIATGYWVWRLLIQPYRKRKALEVEIMNTSDLSLLIMKTLMVALGLAISVLGILVLFNNYSESTRLLLNLKTAIAGTMVLLGIGFLILAFNSIGRKSSNGYDSC